MAAMTVPGAGSRRRLRCTFSIEKDLLFGVTPQVNAARLTAA
jgi:hypothetical protein